jgi:hypothetical protein
MLQPYFNCLPNRSRGETFDDAKRWKTGEKRDQKSEGNSGQHRF